MPPGGENACLIVCPLRVEASWVRRTLRAHGVRHARILVTGPGPERITSVLPPALATFPAGSVVLLAGVAGALSPACRAGAPVPPIGRVIDAAGGSWVPTLGGVGAAEQAPVTLLGLDTPVLTPADKRRLHTTTGAAAVDTESHAFARVCAGAPQGVRWGIVRGISDGADEALPPEVTRWVSPGGGTRPLAAVADLLRKPSLGRVAAQLGRRTSSAMAEVGRQVAEIVRREQGAPHAH